MGNILVVWLLLCCVQNLNASYKAMFRVVVREFV